MLLGWLDVLLGGHPFDPTKQLTLFKIKDTDGMLYKVISNIKKGWGIRSLWFGKKPTRKFVSLA